MSRVELGCLKVKKKVRSVKVRTDCEHCKAGSETISSREGSGKARTIAPVSETHPAGHRSPESPETSPELPLNHCVSRSSVFAVQSSLSFLHKLKPCEQGPS